MNKTKTEAIKATIKSKIEYGDFNTLAKVLGVPYETAKKRFNRSNPKTVLIMGKIIGERVRMIEKIKKELESQGKEVISIEIVKKKKGAIGVAPKEVNK